MTPFEATWRGAITALVVVFPVAVFNQLLIAGGDIGPDSPVTFLFWALILFGGAAGGWAVIRLCPAAGLQHAAGAAALAYVVVQGVGAIRRLWVGEQLSWLAFPLLALMMATVGMFGGMFARRWNRQMDTG